MKQITIQEAENKKINVASISGGRTSHYEIHALIEEFGRDNLHLVYCDTGAEHDGTYKFIRDTEKMFEIEITCIRLTMPKEEGVGCQYELIGIDDIKRDYYAFNELMEKYGRPYNPGGKFCTDQMKTQIYRKYCNETFGKGMYTTWIGYRDEPRDASRAWGDSISKTLNKWFDTPKSEQADFYRDCVSALNNSVGCLIDHISSFIDDPMSVNNYPRVIKVADRVVKNTQIGYRFLFEISDFDNEDIKNWWAKQEFDLDIPKLCGNCIFCIEKTINQLSYLCHTQNKLALEWLDVVESDKIPTKDRKENENAMYRSGGRKMSFREVYDEAISKPLEFWADNMKMETKLSPCASGSCDLFNVEDDQYILEL